MRTCRPLASRRLGVDKGSRPSRITIESDGTPRFPYTIGRWFYGTPSGGAVTAINETVTEVSRGGQASAIVVTATRTPQPASVTLDPVVIITRADIEASGATDLPQLHILQFTEGYGVANNLTGYQVNLWGSLTWDVQNWQLQ